MTPQLRFPEFTDKWQVKKLGSFSKTFSGGTPTSTNPSFYNGNIPFIKSGEIAKNKTSQNISEEALKKSSAKMVESGDILYALYGATSGQVAISQMNGAINQAILCIRPDANRYFIYSKLAADKNTILETYLQGGQGNLSADIIKKLAIATPSKPEQEKIADFLTAVDERISVSEKKLELLETYKRGVMQKIFSQQVRFKEENGKPYPEWMEKAVSEFLKERKEYTSKGGDLEHISLTTVGVVPKSERYERDFLVGSTDKQYRITRLDDICYNPANLKFGVIARNKYKDGIFSPIYVTYVVTNADIGFVEYLVTSRDFIQRARKYEQGTVYERMAVSPQDIAKLKVRMPVVDEQQKIATFLTALDEKITAEKSKLTATHKFKKALLQRMFV